MLPQSNYTQVPNRILDHMHDLEGSEFKVIMLIVRQTIGYHRREHQLSLSFLQSKTGLSRQGVINATESLLEKNWITKQKSGQSFLFGINLEPINNEVVNSVDQNTPTSQLSRPEVVNSVDYLEPKLVNSVDTYKERSSKEKERNDLPLFERQEITQHPTQRSENHYRQCDVIDPDRPWIISRSRNNKYDPSLLDEILIYLAKYCDTPPTMAQAKIWLKKAEFSEERLAAAQAIWDDLQAQKEVNQKASVSQSDMDQELARYLNEIKED